MSLLRLKCHPPNYYCINQLWFFLFIHLISSLQDILPVIHHIHKHKFKLIVHITDVMKTLSFQEINVHCMFKFKTFMLLAISFLILVCWFVCSSICLLVFYSLSIYSFVCFCDLFVCLFLWLVCFFVCLFI